LILLIFPAAVSLYQISVYGFSVAMIFFIVLTIGFILEIGSGAIKLSEKKSNFNPLRKVVKWYNYELPTQNYQFKSDLSYFFV
jgi:hypothetical protein